MSALRARAAVVGFVLFALVGAGCGQKPGVASLPDPRASVQGALVLPEGTTLDPGTGQIVDPQGHVLGSMTSP